MSTWNLEALYPSTAEWEKEYLEIESTYFRSLCCFQGKVQENLEEVLDLYFSFQETLERLRSYAHLTSDTDLENLEKRERREKIDQLSIDFETALHWLKPEIQSLISLPALPKYDRFFTRIERERRYTLSLQEEKLIWMHEKTRRSYPLFVIFSHVELSFSAVEDSFGKSHLLTHASFQTLLKSQDRKLRKAAFIEYYGGYHRFRQTLAENFYAHILNEAFLTKARGYSSQLESSLYPHEIPLKVYSQLIETIEENLSPLHKYISWKRSQLGVEEFFPWDLSVDVCQQETILFSKEEAIELVLASISPLGEEYCSIARKGIESEGWIDWYEKKGKRSGAYSAGSYKGLPYILLNYTGTLQDVFTLAHELGHSMHTYFAHLHQPYPKAGYPIFLAEIASTFHEELLFHHLLKQNLRINRLSLLHQRVEVIRTTLYAQTLYAHFEWKMHQAVEEGKNIDSHLIETSWKELTLRYYGPEFTWETLYGSMPLRVPHFYSSFYVYQYAIGISAAMAFHDQLLEDPKGTKNRYLDFISAGGAFDPISTLQKSSIDLLTSTPVKKAVEKFDSILHTLVHESAGPTKKSF